MVDAQKSALKKLTTCLREAESQKAELINDLDEERKKLEREVSKNESISTDPSNAVESSSTSLPVCFFPQNQMLQVYNYKTYYMIDWFVIELLFVQDASGDVEEKLKLESTVNELQKKLTEEATAKKQITLLLLEDRKKMATLYLEEKKRSEDLNHLLREEKSKVSKWHPYKLLFP